MSNNSLKKIVLVGCTEYGFNLFKPLLDSGELKISYIITLDDEQSKQYNVSGYKNLDTLAIKYDIPVYYPINYNLKNEKDIEFFKNNKFDLMLMGGWQRLIPNSILDLLEYGGLGLHGSSELLPKGRGRSPVNWSLIEGKKRFLIHLFLLNSGVDSGDIIDIEDFDINDFDTCKTIYYKISILSRKMIINNLDNIFNATLDIKKQVGKETHYPKRTQDDGIIDWSNKTVFYLHNFIRALTQPYPGAFTYYNDIKILIWKAQVFDTRIIYYGKEEGEIVEVFDSGDFIVNCNSGLLLVTEYSDNFKPNIDIVFNKR
jgi:methionyl-tRNA formyltransferase